MDPHEPWQEYRRDRLPRGWAHVLGRDEIEAALHGAGARLRALSLNRPDLPPRGETLSIVDVYS